MRQLYVLLLIAICCSLGCKKQDSSPISYLKHIGDTPYDKELDCKDFAFCNPDTVLHKRALLRYFGGHKALMQDVTEAYKPKAEYEVFDGIIVVRFAVNCKDEVGRVRMQVFDTKSEITAPPKGLEQDLRDVITNLPNWKHPIYQGEDFDGYKFLSIVFRKGKIVEL